MFFQLINKLFKTLDHKYPLTGRKFLGSAIFKLHIRQKTNKLLFFITKIYLRCFKISMQCDSVKFQHDLIIDRLQ